MALPTITPSDFTGWFNISGNSFKKELIQEYIDLFYGKIVCGIIGEPAYLEAESTTQQKWEDLITGVDYTDSEGKLRRNEGIKAQAIAFIYFYFIRDNFQSSQAGKVMQDFENAVKTSNAEIASIVTPRYNSGARNVNGSVKSFIDNYGVIQEPITSFVDNGAGSYTINVASTLYLKDGDLVEVNSIEQVISNLVADTSFDIDTGTPFQYIAGNAIYKPFSQVEFQEQEFVTV